MLSTLLGVMGVCASSDDWRVRAAADDLEVEQEKERWEAAAEQKALAAEQRSLVVEASEPVRLVSTSPAFELSAFEAQTVLEVLQIRAEQIGMSKPAAVHFAAWLKLEFAGVIISHENTVKGSGFCDQAEIRVHGEDEANAKWEMLRSLDYPNGLHDADGLHDAVKEGKADEVKLALTFYPERVNMRNEVSAPCSSLAVDAVLMQVELVGVRTNRDPKFGSFRSGEATPLHMAATYNQCKVAEILIAAKARLQARDDVIAPCAPRTAADRVLVGEQHGRGSPLCRAATNGNCEVARILIAAKADVNIKRIVRAPRTPLAAPDSALLDAQNRETPLYWARFKENWDTVEMLMAAGGTDDSGYEHKTKPGSQNEDEQL